MLMVVVEKMRTKMVKLVIETEYLSLRAHYVRELRSLQGARDGLMRQLKLLKDLVEKRGEVLGLYRVRYAMAKDIFHSRGFYLNLGFGFHHR